MKFYLAKDSAFHPAPCSKIWKASVLVPSFLLSHTKPCTLPSFWKKKSALQCRRFSKHPLFPTFPLFLISDVCNASNKYWLPHESATTESYWKLKPLTGISQCFWWNAI